MCVMLQLSEERWSPDHLLLPPEKISGAAGESKLAARIRSRNAGERRKGAEPNTHLRNSRLACSNAADIAIIALFRVMLGSPTIEIC
jgi:hypothetical protein